MAYDHGVLLVPHGWNTAVGVAADLALSAAMPVARWVEYQTGVPYIEELMTPRFQLDADGMLRVPTGPGLGIELNPDALAKYSRKKSRHKAVRIEAQLDNQPDALAKERTRSAAASKRFTLVQSRRPRGSALTSNLSLRVTCSASHCADHRRLAAVRRARSLLGCKLPIAR